MSAQTLLGAAGGLNLTIEQGSRYVLTIEIPVATHPLTGYTARMQARSPKGDGTKLIDWTTENGYITVDAVDNEVQIVATAVQTALLSFNTAKWDLELVPPSGAADAARWLEGTVTLSHEVTR